MKMVVLQHPASLSFTRNLTRHSWKNCQFLGGYSFSDSILLGSWENPETP
jgi:hypothetical protein